VRLEMLMADQRPRAAPREKRAVLQAHQCDDVTESWRKSFKFSNVPCLGLI